MECGKPCYDRDLKDYCESCTAQMESAAVESAMNMGAPDWIGPFTEEEFAEIMKFLDKNKDLMKDLSNANPRKS